MNKRIYQPPRPSASEMERLLCSLRASERELDRAVAAEIDAYRSMPRRTA